MIRSDTEGRDAREVIAAEEAACEGGPGTLPDDLDRLKAWMVLNALFTAAGVEGDGVLCLVREGDAVRVARAEGVPEQDYDFEDALYRLVEQA